MKKLIYIVAINFDVQQYATKTWEHYCKKFGFDFKIITEPSHKDMAPHWERYTVIERYPDYWEYLYVDADAMVSWNAPNFFQHMRENKLYAVQDWGSLEWIHNGINGYQDLFGDTQLNWYDYFTTGFMKFDKSHRQLFKDFIEFHEQNKDEINKRQYKTLRKGFDQTPFNFFVRQQNVDVEFMTPNFSLMHLDKKDILRNGLFLQMGHVWQFNGIPHDQRLPVMEQTWNHIKQNYE